MTCMAKKFNVGRGSTRPKWGVFRDDGSMAHDKMGNVLVWPQKRQAEAWIAGSTAGFGEIYPTVENANWIQPIYVGNKIGDDR